MIKNKRNEKGLEGLFYIVDCSTDTNKNWWQLRLKESHYVMSAVCSKEKVLDCLYKICMRYQTEKRLRKALKNCEFTVNQLYIDNCKKEYAEEGIYHNEDVERVVLKAMTDIKGLPTKRRKPLMALKTPDTSTTFKEEVVKKEEDTVTLPIRKKTMKKKIGLIRQE